MVCDGILKFCAGFIWQTEGIRYWKFCEFKSRMIEVSSDSHLIEILEIFWDRLKFEFV